MPLIARRACFIAWGAPSSRQTGGLPYVWPFADGAPSAGGLHRRQIGVEHSFRPLSANPGILRSSSFKEQVLIWLKEGEVDRDTMPFIPLFLPGGAADQSKLQQIMGTGNMKENNVETSGLIGGDETPLVRGPLMRGMPALTMLAAALIISGCQQLPAGHWAGTPCGPKPSDARNCYGSAAPPPSHGH